MNLSNEFAESCESIVSDTLDIVAMIHVLERIETQCQSQKDQCEIVLKTELLESFKEVFGEEVATGTLQEIWQLAALKVINNVVVLSNPTQFPEVMSRLNKLPSLVPFVNSSCPLVQEQTIWLFDNIAQDSIGNFKQQLIDSGLATAVLKAFNINPRPLTSTFKNRTSSLLVRLSSDGALNTATQVGTIIELIPVLTEILIVPSSEVTAFQADDLFVNTNICCTLSQLMDDSSDEAKAVGEKLFGTKDLVKKLIVLCQPEHGKQQAVYSTGALCNLVRFSSSERLMECITLGLLNTLKGLISHRTVSIAGIACQTLFYFCNNGSDNVIEKVVESGIIPCILKVLRAAPPTGAVNKHGSLAIMALFQCESSERMNMHNLVNVGCLQVIASLVRAGRLCGDHLFVLCEALRCVETVMSRIKTLRTFDHVMNVTDNWGGLEDLQSCQLRQVRELANRVTLFLWRAALVGNKEGV